MLPSPASPICLRNQTSYLWDKKGDGDGDGDGDDDDDDDDGDDDDDDDGGGNAPLIF